MHLRKGQFLVSPSELHLLLRAQGPTEVSPVLMMSHTQWHCTCCWNSSKYNQEVSGIVMKSTQQKTFRENLQIGNIRERAKLSKGTSFLWLSSWKRDMGI